MFLKLDVNYVSAQNMMEYLNIFSMKVRHWEQGFLSPEDSVLIGKALL